MAAPFGITAILFVLSLASRVSEEEITAYEQLAALFGQCRYSHLGCPCVPGASCGNHVRNQLTLLGTGPWMTSRTVLVWTHGHSLQGSTLEEYLEGSSPKLRYASHSLVTVDSTDWQQLGSLTDWLLQGVDRQRRRRQCSGREHGSTGATAAPSAHSCTQGLSSLCRSVVSIFFEL